MKLLTKQTILFQGDSVTDCSRHRAGQEASQLPELGIGYPNFIAAQLSAAYPELGLRFINRGISGNRVIDLKNRWQEDCIDLKPDWVSILIGINDTWRRYDRNDPTSAADFAASYRVILKQCQDIGAGIIILEPFVLPVPADRETWREDIDPKIAEVRKLAREFGAVYIALDGLFASLSTQTNPAHWAADGVHPTQAGHMVIAQAWMDAMEM